MPGTGPIRGFAVTLFVGLISNLFTSTFVSKTLFEAVLVRNIRDQRRYRSRACPSSVNTFPKAGFAGKNANALEQHRAR